MVEIITAFITGSLALVGVVVTTRSAAKRAGDAVKIAQAITNEKIDELTREVREHNNFARRMPVVEEKIKVINHRIDDLEREAEELEKKD